MITFPNCKINLGLRVLDKRSDGFHNIESLFFPVALADVLEVIISDDKKLDFRTSGLALPMPDEENICLKAFHLVEREYGIDPVKIHLHKCIPAGSGLGGGSSDAAGMLKILDELFNLNLGNEKLEKLSLELGSDCPFFIRNRPSLVTGRGETLEDYNLSLAEYQLLIVYPHLNLSTAEAYANIDMYRWDHNLGEILAQPVHEWKHELKNDFEKYVFKKYPVISGIKETIYENGAVYSSLTGSGSAVFGIFDREFEIHPQFQSFVTWKGWLK